MIALVHPLTRAPGLLIISKNFMDIPKLSKLQFLIRRDRIGKLNRHAGEMLTGESNFP